MRSKYFLFFGCLFLLLNCNIHHKEVQPGEALARTYCGTCHLFPEPSLLNKIGWKRHALPPMAKLLGIDYMYDLPYGKNTKPYAANREIGKRLSQYYLTEAPDSMPVQNRDRR